MKKAERKAKEIITMIQVVCIMLLLAIICYALAKNIAMSITGHTAPTTVIGCTPVEGAYYYEVTVETETGEIYAYYGNYVEVGEKINATFSGESIVDVK